MDNSGLAYIRTLSKLAPLLEQADHIDVKTVIGNVDMRTFLARMFDMPGWVVSLYYVRAVFVRLLGMRQQRIPSSLHLKPDEVPMQVGKHAGFFKIQAVEEEHYWIAGVEDKHLDALLGVVVEPLPGQQQRRFYVLTIVHYRNWAGPVYFNMIRPFHHLVVGRMARAGICSSRR